MVTMTQDQARRFILSKQGLLGKYRFAGKPGAYQYIRQAGCIQYDPVDVCGKNAELTLQSRVRGFTKKMLADLLYKDRLLVDYTDKELSIWSREDWPFFSSYRDRSKMHGAGFPGIPELEEQAIAYIRKHGPVSSDTLPIQGKVFWHSSMHWSGNWHGASPAARSVLEQLYTDGILLIHHKSGSRKFYDLADRYFSRDLLDEKNPCPDELSFHAWRIRRRVGAVGLLWNRRSDAFLGIDMNTEQREAAFEKLEAEGLIQKAAVEGIRFPVYFLTEDLPLVDAVLSDDIDLTQRLEFLAPLDPMLWDRKLVEAIWDYQYSWEIYTPADKRKYGYYVLPMLYGEKMAGRMEAAADRKAETLVIKNIWYEPGIRQTKKLNAAVDAAIGRLAKFNDCSRIAK
ncbi:MAG: YcaQ family DNA glycosylase [Clostridia bacterium]|nr:YcaQ family DNA glycosylase [Clostridia bacterium]